GGRIGGAVEGLGRETPSAGLVEVRAKGAFTALKLDVPEGGKLLMRLALESGLLCVFAANDTSVLQMLPPLIADEKLADEIVARLGEALRTYAALRGGFA